VSEHANKPVFDASAVLALMQGEPGADKLRGLQPGAVVNAVNAAEVLAKLVNRGMPLTEAQAAYDALHLHTEPFESALAVVSAGYVCKGVSLGDRCFLAAAQRSGSGWTSDRNLGALFGDRVSFLNFFRP
jgi:PIN domain nuclease of toxin-antitoxin system